MLMKNLYVTLAAVMLLLLAVSCKKETAAPQETTLQPGQQEALALSPVTPLDKPIPLPAGSHAGARTAAGERIPIIMVHGLGGLGPDDMLGLYHYWGGIDDIPKYLTNNGYPAFAAKVGPVSSNYDRAMELYYYIKGGYVDYGKFHSAKYGHAQKKAKYYPGIYPQWDAQHPVHLLGHSMGGITIRKLVTLLEKGDALEQQDPSHAGLFNGDKTGWVKSVTSISTPHNGATLTYILLNGYIPFVRQFITAAAALAGGFSGIDNIYDFALEQWGLERQPGRVSAPMPTGWQPILRWQIRRIILVMMLRRKRCWIPPKKTRTLRVCIIFPLLPKLLCAGCLPVGNTRGQICSRW